MSKKLFSVLTVLVVVCIVLGVALSTFRATVEPPALPGEEESPQTATSTVPLVLSYGEAAIAAGETAVFPDVSITVLSVVEDSRCPLDVQCIQAGTVRVSLETVSGLGTSTDILALGDILTTEAEAIAFVSAAPEPRSGSAISESAYTFVFRVEKRPLSEVAPIAEAPEVVGACYVGGCSSQLCTDTPDTVSTCEYREEYACYQNARCERQQSGVCGWTQTAELQMCLSASL